METPQEGKDVVLRLMIRKPGQILALPRDSADSFQGDLPWCFAAEVLDYAKVMKGTEDYMLSQFDKECEEITLQAKEDELIYGEDSTWTQKAIVAIQASRSSMDVKTDESATSPKYHRRGVPIRGSIPDADCLDVGTNGLRAFADREAVDLHARSKPGSASPPKPRTTLESTEPHLQPQNAISKHVQPPQRSMRPKGRRSSAPPNTLFYFYQSLPHYYLTPLDVRILKTAFEGYPSFPTTILPRVDRISMGHVVDDDMRRRIKYLAHLPRGCEVNFLECDFTDIVPPPVLDGFVGEIEQRRKRNREKDLKEEKDRIKSEKEEEKRWAIRRKRTSLPREDVREASAPGLEAKWWSDGDFVQEACEDEDSSARHGLERSRSPFFSALTSPSTSPNSQKTVWGTPAIASMVSNIAYTEFPEGEGQTDDGWLHGWEDRLTDDADLGPRPSAPPDLVDSLNTTSRASGVELRKKRGKKITLMTTSARRAA